MGGPLRQLYIILWKDVYVKQLKRQVVWTLLELAFTAAAMYGIGKDGLELSFGNPVLEEVFPREQPLQLWNLSVARILYTPNVPLLAEVIQKVREDLSITVAEPVGSDDDLDDLVESGFDYGSVVGVAFENDLSDLNNLPDELRYRVRAPGPRFDVHVRYWKMLEVPGPLNLAATGEMRSLLPLQYSLERHLLQQIWEAKFGERPASAQLQMQRFPYPAYYPENFNTTYSRLVFRFGVGFLLPFASVVAKITDEKCSGMRELLSIAGTSELVYWGSHFLSSSFSALLLSCVCMLFLYVFGSDPVLGYSDPLLVLVVLVNFNSLAILHAMFISVLLTSSRLSIIVSMMYWICSIAFPYLMLQNPLGRGYYLRSRASKIITSVSPGMGLHWAFMVIERFERFRGGVHWGNMREYDSTLDNVSLSELLVVNVCTCFLMVFLIWYADNIIPWGPGIHKPPWFPFLRSYWLPQPARNVKIRQSVDPTLFESDPQDLNPAIQVISLKKFYRNFLLQRINLKIYRHQITVLTGPAGSGKSTMIKMITGLVPPSSGQIIVDNYDVVLHTEEARERIAYCPADNVLFDELTVEEHLIFFAMLKGLSASKIRVEINLLLTDIQMSAYMSYRPSTLSDGMKRLLCVAITLLVASKSKIMVFDEPTATMDPHSQREVWELLLKARRHCCILLTTQNLREADVLGDKVGIMNKGLLWCSGSPGFLRERFRAGYNIRIAKEPGCDTAAVETVLRRHIPRAAVKNDSNAEAEFAMGANPGNRRLTAMFKELDRERRNLKIGAMSVAMSSLDEVLDKVVHDPTFQSGIETCTPAHTDDEPVYRATKEPGSRSCARQLAWLLKKRFYIWLRDWNPPVVRWVVPVCVLLLATHLQRQFSEEDIVSSNFYKDRLQYTIRALHVPSPLSFVSANRSRGDPVVRHLRKLFAEEDVRPVYIGSDHTSSRLLDYAEEYPRLYNYRMLFGVVFTANSTPTLWYNGQCPHAAPLLVNLYHSAVLRNITDQPAARFVLVSHPYSNETGRHGRGGADEKRDLQQLLQSKLFFGGVPLSADTLVVEVLMGIFVPLALCFHAASFVVFPITELCSEFKRLQLMTGVSGIVYWLSNFVFDTALAAACAFVFVPTICFSHRYLKRPEYIAVLSMLFLAHGLSMVPFCYVVSSHFKDSSFGFSIMVIFIFFTGLVGALEAVIVHFTLTVAEARLLSLVPQALDILFRGVPTFTLTRGIAQLLRLRRENDICEAGEEQLAIACRTVDLSHTTSLKYCCNALPTRNASSVNIVDGGRRTMIQPYELSCAVMIEVYVMLVEAVVLLAFVAFMDATPYHRLRRKVLARFRRREDRALSPDRDEGPRLATSPLDSDVAHESAVVEKLASEPKSPEYALVVRKLTKSFGPCRGVNNVSFALKRGQCLGIIGVTGSGKTKLMQLLTATSECSSGDVYIGSWSLLRTPREYASNIGYCPEALDLPEHLTGREVIELICVLRGFRLDDTATMANNLLHVMELSKVANVIVKHYAPGDKRKLCIAIALAGLPRVILLDEPSTGVDVAAQAQIRRSLSIIRESTDCAILLTSNSMQQCEVLCDRIGILLAGQLECIGTVDELKSKFGRGYTIIIRLRQESADDSDYHEDLTNDMKGQFHGCHLEHCCQPGKSLNPVQLTLEQKTVLSAVLAGRSVFFTGGAGTGKSYLLRHILSSLPPQDAFATATTGIAAAQIGGTTLHSFAGVGTGMATVEVMMQRAMRPPWVNQWRRCKVLVVDEVSMLDGRFFHKLERVARLVRRSDRPFGGIQLVLCGDFLQLPPVSRKEEPAPVFCFQTSAWRQCIHITLELKQVHRQSDPRFISLLQQVRVGSCPDWVEEVLKKTASRCLETGDIVATRLSTHTDDVDFMNQRCFDQLPSSPRIFKAIDSEGSPADLLEACAPSTLSLKVGTQVMLTKNTQVRAGLANGSRGVVVGFDSASGDPIVQFVNSCKQTITKERWAIRTGPEGLVRAH
ncbi:phospholipid-transporting ATPase ABCA3-like [Dermacentor variabilis]|uniref:phospholipid-transporting ATPase ABCA3-like n=1 Tax=Dermacentor variabilis TaxID=34621 RepID=UPI003F5C8183